MKRHNAEIVTFGEIMLRLSPPGNLKTLQTDSFNTSYAGSEANIAVDLAQLNESVRYVTALSLNDLGNKILHELRKYNLDTKHIVRNKNRQGLIFIEKGAMCRASKVIYDREDSAFSSIKPGQIDWNAAFKNAQWFHWSGITPALSNNLVEVMIEALQTARDAKMTISVDLNYRSSLWQYGKSSIEVMTELAQHCDVIIGNEEDADKCLGVKVHHPNTTEGYEEISRQHYEQICSEIHNKFPNAHTICFTLRESVNANHNRWSGVIHHNGTTYHSQRYDLTHIVDRVGAGDSFSAGIIYGLRQFKKDYQRVLEFATAASAIKHSIEGDFNLTTFEEIEMLRLGNKSGRIAR